MRTIYLVRHAKAEAIADTDKKRALSKTGVCDAEKLGRLFSDKLQPPVCIICSDSDRTRQTLDAMSQTGLSADHIIYDEELYHASTDYVKDLMLTSLHDRIMIIGHNPSLAILLNKLAPTDAVAADMMHFPTGSMAELQINNDLITLQTFIKGADL